jgi:SAM-dependent methyltransferase
VTTDKAHGYVTEITYPFNYYRELNPNIQCLALTAAGLASPALDRPFTYIELGCGLGLGTLIHGAANPHAQFIGIDVNPDHITVARGIAAAAGLDNVDFRELAFEDLEAAGLPQFDFVAMHGVWSWVNDFNRQVLLRFMDTHLKEGGVVYSSYNTQPGYSAIMPLRELMMIGYGAAKGSIAMKVEAGLAYGQRIKALEAAYFRANPLLGKYLDDIMPLGRGYLAHEYFNADWWSFFFSQIAAQHAPLGLRFGASAHLMDNLDALNYSPEMRAAIGELADPVQRETLKDFLANRQFRRDLMVRHPTPLADAETALRALPFAAAVLPQNVHRVTGTTMLGEVRPRADVAQGLATAFAAGAAPLGEAMQHPALSGHSPAAVIETLMTMAALGAAEPALAPAALSMRKPRTHRLNQLLWERALHGDDVSATASPVTGGAVGLATAEQLFLLARARGEDPVGLVRQAMPDQRPEVIAHAYETFAAGRIPLLQTLGIA